MSIPEGTAVGSIIIGEPLASGDDGDVYAGQQPGVGRRVAVRVLRRGRLHEAGLVERLQREASLGGRLAHPNLVQVLDYFAFRDDHYLVTEYVEGTNLGALLERTPTPPRELVASILLEVARGLEELHARGIVHGELRPRNVLISRWGEVKLKGLAQARELAEPAPEIAPRPNPWSSPELGRGRRIGPASDVYSLGAMLFESLTGERFSPKALPPAFRRSRLMRLALACLESNPADRPGLDRVFRRLARVPGDTTPRGARIEIAAWLWKQRVLERDPSEPARGASTNLPVGVTLPFSLPDGRSRPAASPAAPESIPLEFAPPEASAPPTSGKGTAGEAGGAGRFAPRRAEWLASESALATETTPEEHRPDQPRDRAGPTVGARALSELRRVQAGVGSLGGQLKRVRPPLSGARSAITGAAALVGRLKRVRPPLPGPRSAIAGAAAIGVIGIGLAAFRLGAPLEGGAEPPPAVSAIGENPARVTFAVHPWARVEIENGPVVVTPHAEPVELAPGTHSVILRHPSLGETRQELTLAPGETRIVRHRFAMEAR